MRVGLFNACGITGKADNISTFSVTHGIDLMVVVETHLTKTNSLSGIGKPFINLMQPDFRIHGKQQGRGHHGVCAFADPPFSTSHIKLSEDPGANFIIFKLSDLIIGFGYFPPINEEMDRKLLDFLDQMIDLAGDSPCLAFGDFNARLGILTGDDRTNGRGEQLKDWLMEHPDIKVEKPSPENWGYTCWPHGGGRSVTEVVLSRRSTVSN